jgi:hypothetical protein
MKRLALLCAVAAVLAFPSVGRAQAPHEKDSPKTDLHLTSPILIGSTTLKAGDYKFQCRVIDGQHFLVVTSEEDGKELARVPCTPESLDKKVTTSEFRSKKQPDGSVVLTAVRIKGETVAHRVAN